MVAVRSGERPLLGGVTRGGSSAWLRLSWGTPLANKALGDMILPRPSAPAADLYTRFSHKGGRGKGGGEPRQGLRILKPHAWVRSFGYEIRA